MTTLSHHDDDTESRQRGATRPIAAPQPATTPAVQPPSGVSLTRVLVGTTVATGAGILGVIVGLPLIAATAAGAVVGSAAVAVLSAQHAPVRR